MLKAATLFLTFLLGRMNSSGHESFFSPEDIIDNATDKITGKLRGLMGQFALGAIGAILMTAGFLVAFFHVLDQWDVTDIVVIDAVFTGGVVLAVAGLIMFGFALRIPQKAVKVAEKKAKEQVKDRRSHGSLEDAIAAFIQDHVKEREFAREERRQRNEQRNNFYTADSSRKTDKTGAHVH